MYKEFQEEAYSIALHPTGLYILVGFSDKLRLMTLLIDDIRTFKEFTVRSCREVRLHIAQVCYYLFIFLHCIALTKSHLLHAYTCCGLTVVANFPYICPQCVFSHGGHLFAAVNGNVINIYSTTTFEDVLNLKGHNEKVCVLKFKGKVDPELTLSSLFRCYVYVFCGIRYL